MTCRYNKYINCNHTPSLNVAGIRCATAACVVANMYLHVQLKYVSLFNNIVTGWSKCIINYSSFHGPLIRVACTVFPRIVSAESILFRSCQLRLLNEGGY